MIICLKTLIQLELGDIGLVMRKSGCKKIEELNNNKKTITLISMLLSILLSCLVDLLIVYMYINKLELYLANVLLIVYIVHVCM